MKKTKCVAMLLAGGQGSRLGVLTRKVAKPAVPYGGKYRIIDFPLSNCINSGINVVGVVTQYQPLELNEYIGSGKPWDLDRNDGGVHVLSPYQRNQGADWFKGTANAVYQNIRFIERYNPEHVLVLSGDHIYKMDYSKMLDEHEKNNADCTIAVFKVPHDEASRFGIMNTTEDGTVYEFEEKPQNPKSDLASMGIYVFKWEKLKQFLIDDENNPDSSNDFGKDIIPKMLNSGQLLRAYPFEGYWKDVGTIGSLWESNLDLLNPTIGLNLSDRDWRIYSGTQGLAPQYIAPDAKVENSLVTDDCKIYGNLDYSIIFNGVTVEKGAKVAYSLIMPGAVIKSGATVQYSIVAEDSIIESGAVVGDDPESFENVDDWDVAVVGDKLTVGKNAKVKAGSMVTENVKEGQEV